jgi:DNA gyrase subunit A
MAQFGLSQPQAQAILDMRLQRLTGLERQKLLDELAELKKQITYLNKVLASQKLLMGIIKDELKGLADRYGDGRRTEIVPETGEISIEDMIKQEEMVITVSHGGYIKRVAVSTYRSQRRGGKGKVAMGTKEEDFVALLFVANTHDYLMFFTDWGRVHWLKVWEVPELGRTARGKAVVNLLLLEEGEQLTSILPVGAFREDRFVVMATRAGVIKKTVLSAYGHPRAGGIIAINLDEGDRLISARITDGNQKVLMATRKGISIQFPEDDARPLGRATRGVRGIALGKGDEVIAMEVVQEDSTILSVTENGYGKRTDLAEFRVQGRGGKGIIAIKTGKRNGDCIGVLPIGHDDQVMMVAASGKIIRLNVEGIRTIGRNTQGVRLIHLEGGDRVVGLAPLAEKVEPGEQDLFEEAEIEEVEPDDDDTNGGEEAE